VISGTIFEQTKLPLTTWFMAIHLITQAKTGLSALALNKKIVGLKTLDSFFPPVRRSNRSFTVASGLA